MSKRTLRRSAPWGLAMIVSVAACTGTTVIPAGSGGSGGSSTSTSTSSTSSTGSMCVDLDPSIYNTTCQADSDCILVYVGELCAGYNCACPNGTIRSSASAEYQEAFSSVPPSPGSGCGCPLTGDAQCIAGQCTFCAAAFVDGGTQFVCPTGG